MTPYKNAVTATKHVALVPEVQHAFEVWFHQSGLNVKTAGVLIGGLAMSFYRPPRYTEDIDILFLHQSDIPNELPKFKRIRPGAFQENHTQVEIEVVTPVSFQDLPVVVVQKVIDTAVLHNGVKVASREAMVVLKLYSSFARHRRLKDLADVESLVINQSPSISLNDWHLEPKHSQRLQEVLDGLKE